MKILQNVFFYPVDVCHHWTTGRILAKYVLMHDRELVLNISIIEPKHRLFHELCKANYVEVKIIHEGWWNFFNYVSQEGFHFIVLLFGSAEIRLKYFSYKYFFCLKVYY